MTRKEFFKLVSIFSIGLPLKASLSSCATIEMEGAKALDFNGKVIIIGAGAGGLSAGYFLQQRGIDFEILEASPSFGGRMKIDTEFSDFPIPLGAEWLETQPTIFKEILNDDTIQLDIKTVEDEGDYKFINYSWYSFFEDFILPAVADNIRYNTVVQSVNYTGSQTIVSTQNGEYKADRLIVSVPLKVLQAGDIRFTPSLPENKQEAIQKVEIFDGFKAFFEFKEHFYDEGQEIKVRPSKAGEKLYYDATLGQNTDKNILGLFMLGKPVDAFSDLDTAGIRDLILRELDELYDNQASPNYIKHTFQNWQNEPFIKGGYLSSDAPWRDVITIGEPIDNKIYFAGGEYTDGENWVSVHLAAQSAKKNIEKMLQA